MVPDINQSCFTTANHSVWNRTYSTLPRVACCQGLAFLKRKKANFSILLKTFLFLFHFFFIPITYCHFHSSGSGNYYSSKSKIPTMIRPKLNNSMVNGFTKAPVGIWALLRFKTFYIYKITNQNPFKTWFPSRCNTLIGHTCPELSYTV